MKYLHLFEQFDKESIITSTINNPNFVGYHCSPSKIREFDGRVIIDYADDRFNDLLLELGMDDLLEKRPEGKFGESKEIDKWCNKVKDLLDRKGIRWIYVATDKPHLQYGENVYGVLLDESKCLFSKEDYNEINSYIYVYQNKKVKPTLVPFFEMPEQPKADNSLIDLNSTDEGLGIFKRIDNLPFPWEMDELSFNYPNFKIPYRITNSQEKQMYAVLGLPNYSLGSAWALFKAWEEFKKNSN